MGGGPAAMSGQRALPIPKTSARRRLSRRHARQTRRRVAGVWSLALRLGRVSNLPTVWSNVLAGAVLSGHAVTGGPLALLLLSLSLIYVAGMYLNDVCDRHIDARERPERPIPAGLASARLVLLAGAAQLAVGVALLAALGLSALLAGLCLAATVVLYDLWHKHNPLSPLLMGLCRMQVYLISGLALGAGALSGPLLLAALALLAYLIALTYVAKQEGRAGLGRLAPLLGLAAPPLYLLSQPFQPWALPFLLLSLGWSAHCLRLAWPGPGRDMPRAVGGLIAGIALADALFIAAAGQPQWAALAVLAAWLTRTWQRRVPGT
ncbi:UbiA family prenyltransferase [Chromobacterium haemolyticum]|uniref:UbiA family prenyltransferase n=2 Tax=Chromobacteriaceae TaxID=1499392 RepID=UPI00307FBEBA